MTAAELIATVRRLLNDENSQTYKWTDAELVDYFNTCIDTIAMEANYFIDSTTTLLTDIALTAGTADYAFDTRLLDIKSIRIAGETRNLDRATSKLRDDEEPTWRFSNSVSGTDIALDTSEISSTTTDFLEAGFAADDFIQITGSATSGNNKVVKLETVEQYSMDLATGHTLTARVAGDRLVLKQLTTGTPLRYMTDYRTGYTTLSPAPDEDGSMILSVIKLQDTPLTTAILATPGTYVIPVNYQYHIRLANGIMADAYLKSGPSTFNIDKATVHNARFMKLIDRMKKDMIKLNGANTILRPHSGTM